MALPRWRRTILLQESFMKLFMTEQTSKKYTSFKDQIPEDVREHMRTAREEMRKSVIGLLPPAFVEHLERQVTGAPA
jgi:hypothetical protein